MSKSTVPTITRADRPLNSVYTADLVEMILDLDPHAVIEAQLRLDHSATLQPQNRRRLTAALAEIAAPTLTVVPDPEPAPTVKVRSAKAIATERAKELGRFEGVRTAVRIGKAIDAGWDLTDDDTLVTACVTKTPAIVAEGA